MCRNVHRCHVCLCLSMVLFMTTNRWNKNEFNIFLPTSKQELVGKPMYRRVQLTLIYVLYILQRVLLKYKVLVCSWSGQSGCARMSHWNSLYTLTVYTDCENTLCCADDFARTLLCHTHLLVYTAPWYVFVLYNIMPIQNTNCDFVFIIFCFAWSYPSHVAVADAFGYQILNYSFFFFCWEDLFVWICKNKIQHQW